MVLGYEPFDALELKERMQQYPNVHIAAAEFSSEVPDQVIVYHDEKKIVDMLEAINEKLDIRMGY